MTIHKAYKWSRIKYFSKDGQSMPNGHSIQKGGFLQACAANADSFWVHNCQYFIDNDFKLVANVDEAKVPEPCNRPNFRGGIIVFRSDTHISDTEIIDWVTVKLKRMPNHFFTPKTSLKTVSKIKNKSCDCVGFFSIGNLFKGSYATDNGIVFNEQSNTIEVNGLSAKGFIRFSEELAEVYKQDCFLIKDFNKSRLFFLEQISSCSSEN